MPLYDVNVRAIVTVGAELPEPAGGTWEIYDHDKGVARCDTLVRDVEADDEAQAIERAKGAAPPVDIGFVVEECELWVDADIDVSPAEAAPVPGPR